MTAQIIIVMVCAAMFFHSLIGLDRMTSKDYAAPFYVWIPLLFVFLFNVAMLGYCISGQMDITYKLAAAAYISQSLFSLAIYKAGITISHLFKK